MITWLVAQSSRARYLDDDDYYDAGNPLDLGDPFVVFALTLFCGLAYAFYRLVVALERSEYGRIINALFVTIAVTPYIFIISVVALQAVRVWTQDDVTVSLGSVLFSIYASVALLFFSGANAWVAVAILSWAWKRVKD